MKDCRKPILLTSEKKKKTENKESDLMYSDKIVSMYRI